MFDSVNHFNPDRDSFLSHLTNQSLSLLILSKSFAPLSFVMSLFASVNHLFVTEIRSSLGQQISESLWLKLRFAPLLFKDSLFESVNYFGRDQDSFFSHSANQCLSL